MAAVAPGATQLTHDAWHALGFKIAATFVPSTVALRRAGYRFREVAIDWLPRARARLFTRLRADAWHTPTERGARAYSHTLSGSHRRRQSGQFVTRHVELRAQLRLHPPAGQSSSQCALRSQFAEHPPCGQ